jgi:ElaB/YqjD/DUF883 family membrane-anchored ribosome-binding protein
MADENQMRQNPMVSPQAEVQAERGTTRVHKATEGLRSAAEGTADKYRARAKEVWDDALHRVRGFQDESKQYIRANPIKAVFTAFGVGLALGLIFRSFK